jgi:hypothetical protein
MEYDAGDLGDHAVYETHQGWVQSFTCVLPNHSTINWLVMYKVFGCIII